VDVPDAPSDPKRTKGTLRFVTSEIMADPAEIGRGSDEMIAQLAGISAEPTETDLYRWGRAAGPTLEAKASDARLPLVLLAQVAAAREQSMDVHTWRSPTAHTEARWLKFLAGTGYALSPIEQAVIDTMAANDDSEEDSATDNPAGEDRASGDAAA
jgi:hypothetical protein